MTTLTLTRSTPTEQAPTVRLSFAPSDAAFAARYRAGRREAQALSAMQDSSYAALCGEVSERLRSL